MHRHQRQQPQTACLACPPACDRSALHMQGQRQSTLEYDASREVARTITQRSTAEQAKWLSSIDPGAGAATALDVSPFTGANQLALFVPQRLAQVD